jgi:hypothetical protein
VLVGLYLLFLPVYLFSTAGHFFSTDHVAVYLTTESLVERGDLAIKPLRDTVPSPGGGAYSQFGIGQSLLSIPLYLLGTTVEALGSPELRRYFAGADLGDWGGSVPIFFVGLLNAFITPLSCLLVFLLSRTLGFAVGASLGTTLLFGFSTAAWVYAREYFQHPLESLLLLAAVSLLVAQRQRLLPRHAFLAGLALGCGVLVRLNLILLAPPLLAYILYRTGLQGGRARRWLGQGVAFGLPLLAAAGLLLQLNAVKFGEPLDFGPNATTIGFSTPLWVGLYGNLFSVGRSVLLYSPPLLLALFAYPAFYRQWPAEALLFLAIVLTYLLVYSTYGVWSGGWAWGQRYLVPTIPFLVIPLGYLYQSWWKLALVGLLGVLGVAVQVLGVAVNQSYVNWDWIRMNLVPEHAEFFVPEISPIPMHLRALVEGRHIDLWIVWVYQQFGPVTFLATLVLPGLTLLVGLGLLAAGPREQGSSSGKPRGRSSEADRLSSTAG